MLIMVIPYDFIVPDIIGTLCSVSLIRKVLDIDDIRILKTFLKRALLMNFNVSVCFDLGGIYASML